jgi:hypothetical protein
MRDAYGLNASAITSKSALTGIGGRRRALAEAASTFGADMMIDVDDCNGWSMGGCWGDGWWLVRCLNNFWWWER